MLRPLAVTTATRWEGLPSIPTVGEFLPGFESSGWHGVGAPKNTPPEIIDKLNKEINASLADPKIKARLADLAATPMPMTRGSPDRASWFGYRLSTVWGTAILCQEGAHTVQEMKEGPSESSCRRRLQTAMSCFGQKPRW